MNTKQIDALKLALEALKQMQAMANFECWNLDICDEAITAIREALAEQPAPVQGWKLVPIEPTEDMWKAVNKLDDEMAAGSYDGKGCSIEQAWNCLLNAAPTPPAQPSKPLTDEQIDRAIAELGLNYLADASNNRAVLRELCRKAAHGIKGDI